MPILRRIAVLQTQSAAFPESRPPDPRRAIDLRAGEDTDLIVTVLDDGGSPVFFADGMEIRLTVRPTPEVDDERVMRIAGEPLPLDGPNIWRFRFGAQETRRKSPEFTRGFYDVVLLRNVGEPNEQRDYVISASPFRLWGAPGAQ